MPRYSLASLTMIGVVVAVFGATVGSPPCPMTAKP